MEQGHGHHLHRCHTILHSRRLHLRLAGYHRKPRDRMGRRRSPLENLPRRPPLCTPRLAGRTRRPIPTTSESLWTAKRLCRQRTFPPRRPHHPATAAPRHGHHRDRVDQTRTGLSRLDPRKRGSPGPLEYSGNECTLNKLDIAHQRPPPNNRKVPRGPFHQLSFQPMTSRKIKHLGRTALFDVPTNQRFEARILHCDEAFISNPSLPPRRGTEK